MRFQPFTFPTLFSRLKTFGLYSIQPLHPSSHTHTNTSHRASRKPPSEEIRETRSLHESLKPFSITEIPSSVPFHFVLVPFSYTIGITTDSERMDQTTPPLPSSFFFFCFLLLFCFFAKRGCLMTFEKYVSSIVYTLFETDRKV